MPNYDALNAGQILQQVLADGFVAADEVSALTRKLDQDWIVERNEVELLFRVNQSLGGKVEKCPEWTPFFIETVSRLVLLDLDNPGEIDEAEGDWLADMFDQHASGNIAESALLDVFRENASRVSGRIAQRL